MSPRAYLVISGVIFGVVAIVHLLRVLNGWLFLLGPWDVPMGASVAGTVVPAALCIWAFVLAAKSPTP